jgi:hypothetical protein
VSEALPERMRNSVLSALNQAYGTGDPKRARRLLENLARRLEPEYPGAAGSLREGLEETLTVMRLNLPESLERVLSSTNLIENLFSRVREIARRVKRWQGGTMILRWTAAGVLEAERCFRKIAAYRGLPKLVAALRAHDLERDEASKASDPSRRTLCKQRAKRRICSLASQVRHRSLSDRRVATAGSLSRGNRNHTSLHVSISSTSRASSVAGADSRNCTAEVAPTIAEVTSG